MVGREGLYPIKVHQEDGKAGAAVFPVKSFSELVPRGWVLITLLLLLLLISLWLWAEEVESPSQPGSQSTWKSWKSSLSHCLWVPDATDSEQRIRLRALSLALLGLAGLGYLVMGAPVLARLSGQFWAQQACWQDRLGVIVAMGILLLPVVAVTGKLAKGSARLAGGRIRHYLFGGLGYLAFYAFILRISFGPSERAMNLNSGVSPTLPILLLLGVPSLWVLSGVYRCYVMRNLAGLLNGDRRLIELAEPYLLLLPNKEQILKLNFLLLVMAIVLLPSIYLLLYFFSFPVRGIETNPFFNWGVGTLLLGSILLVSEASFRCLSAWRRLRRHAPGWLDQNYELRSYLEGQECPPDSQDSDPTEDREDTQAYLANQAKIASEILNRIIRQIRTLLLFATLALVLILAALLTYPFEPDRVLALYMSILIAGGALVAVIVNLQISKNEALRCIRGIQEGWWTWERAGRLLFYLGVPAAGLIASRFPGTLDSLLGWLEPIFNVFA